MTNQSRKPIFRLMAKFFGSLFFSSIFIFLIPSAVLAANVSDVVINEIYYDVDSAHGAETTNEWVELYNTTGSAVDISSWTLTDNSSTKTIPAGATVPAHGVALVTPEASTWNFWSVDASVAKIFMAIGNGLSNTGDKVLLKDNSGKLIDAVSYGTNIDVWNPAAVDVDEAHSLERNPAGKDSDSAGDFIDQETPTPGRLIVQAIVPTPSPAQSSTTSYTVAAASVSPTPIVVSAKSPTPTPKVVSPMPLPSPLVLAEATESATPSAITVPSPSASPEAKSNLSAKAAGIIIGAGFILIGLSAGFYLWYRRALGPPKKKDDNKNDVEQKDTKSG